MKSLAWTFCVVALCAGLLNTPAQSAPGNAAPTSDNPVGKALPAGCTATLHFERAKVGAGAIPNDAHRSRWWIEVRDAKGKPKAGVTVSLPVITKGGKGMTSESPVAAIIEWLPTTKMAPEAVAPISKNALTNADGKAWGVFTSGNRTEAVQLSASGGATASILQVWNEGQADDDDGWMVAGTATDVTYKMGFYEAGKWIPLTGHHLRIRPRSVRFNVTNPDLGPDEDGDGRPDGTEDVVTYSEEKPDEVGWKTWLTWSTYSEMVETAPGVYAGSYLGTFPENAQLDGKIIYGIENVGYFVEDDDACEAE